MVEEWVSVYQMSSGESRVVVQCVGEKGKRCEAVIAKYMERSGVSGDWRVGWYE